MSVRQMTLVWEYSRAEGNVLLLALALADWADDDGYCYPSFRQLAKKARIDRSTAIRGIGKLLKSGELEQLEAGHREKTNAGRAAHLRWQKTNGYRLVVGRAGGGKLPLPHFSTGGTVPLPDVLQVVANPPPQVVANLAASLYVSTDPSVEQVQSNGADAPQLPVEAVEIFQASSQPANLKQLEKLVHEQLDLNPFETIADLSDAVKTRAARLHFLADPQLLARAVSSVLVTRGYERRATRRAQ